MASNIMNQAKMKPSVYERVTGIELSLTRFNVLKTLHIYPLNDCPLLLILTYSTFNYIYIIMRAFTPALNSPLEVVSQSYLQNGVCEKNKNRSPNLKNLMP